MKEKHLFLCSECMNLIQETQKLRQFMARKEEKGKCEWCGKERFCYHCIVGGDGQEPDRSYPIKEVP